MIAGLTLAPAPTVAIMRQESHSVPAPAVATVPQQGAFSTPPFPAVCSHREAAYSAQSAYKMLQARLIKFKGHHLVWKRWVPLKVKFFLWLALRQRHWTGDRRLRHGLEAREMCYLCDQEVETIDHIIASCSYSREVWHRILQVLHRPFPQLASTTFSWWKHL